ncbi:MAG: hypothetical protein WAR81_01685, partial [Pseudomonadales bacterium]
SAAFRAGAKRIVVTPDPARSSSNRGDRGSMSTMESRVRLIVDSKMLCLRWNRLLMAELTTYSLVTQQLRLTSAAQLWAWQS